MRNKLFMAMIGFAMIATAYALPGNYVWAIGNILVSEGGSLYTNHPNDPGGPTKYGITIWDVRKYLNPQAKAQDVRNLTQAEAVEIFRAHYWNAIGADTLPSGVDYAATDYAVNAGIGRALPTLRKCQTQHPTDAIEQITCITDNRMSFQMGLPAKYNVFKRGWRNRIKSVDKLAKARNRNKLDKGYFNRDMFLVPHVGLGKAYNPAPEGETLDAVQP